jgi:hypothetical protein
MIVRDGSQASAPDYAARPPVTATLDAVDVMSTSVDRAVATTKAKRLKALDVAGYRQDGLYAMHIERAVQLRISWHTLYLCL